MSARWPWSELGLKGKADLRDVKRAYAVKLKSIDRDNPEDFQRLRDAFSAAKARATTQGTGKKPSMRQAAGKDVGFDVEPDLRPIPDGETVIEPDVLGSEPEQKSGADPVNPMSHTSPQTETPESNPWGASLSIEDEEDKFFRDLHRTFKDSKWRINDLDALLSRDIALTRNIRERAENILFTALSEAVTEEKKLVSSGIANVMEQHFGWATDGVRFQKKFGYRSGVQEICYDVARHVNGHGSVPSKVKAPIHAKRLRIAIGIAIYLTMLGKVGLEYFSGGATFIASAVFAAICFGVFWLVATFLFVATAVMIGALSKIPLVGPRMSALWTKARAKSRWISDFDAATHHPAQRGTIVFALAGALSVITTVLL